MSQPTEIQFQETDLETIAQAMGRVALIIDPEAGRSPCARRINRLTKGALDRAIGSEAFGKLKAGDTMELAYPAGMECEALSLVVLPKKTGVIEARKAGAAIGKSLTETGALVLAENHARAAEISFGLALKAYRFEPYLSEAKPAVGAVVFAVSKPEEVAAKAAPLAALAEGVFFTRDLVNEPANILTTDDFAGRLAAMQELGLEVEILEEPELEKLGMRSLLAVGQGSESPSKVVVMRWKGGADEAPLALVGKGVVFDTGGISIKPAAGMEEMTMDMGGAGVVSGVMRTLALRKAKANVVGLVGLVENMPDGKAQRPGDIVRSMKGETIECVNTDAEGRMVLADVLWYAQERFEPRAVIDLATLTGAIIIALGHEKAGIFGNDDGLVSAIVKSAEAEGEGAWPMPMGAGYEKLIKTRLADIKNTGGRAAGSITAAQFLGHFVKEGTPWAHIDIAGVALPPSETALAPKGPSGWGVIALDRLIRDRFEG